MILLFKILNGMGQNHKKTTKKTREQNIHHQNPIVSQRQQQQHRHDENFKIVVEKFSK